MIHATLAGLSGAEHWQITEPEAKLVGDCGANVARHYPSVKVAQKYQDWFNLTFALGSVYGVRLKMSRDIRLAARPPKSDVRLKEPLRPGEVEIPGIGRVPVMQ